MFVQMMETKTILNPDKRLGPIPGEVFVNFSVSIRLLVLNWQVWLAVIFRISFRVALFIYLNPDIDVLHALYMAGVDVGHQFFSRAEMVIVGFHSHWLNGIDYIGKTASKVTVIKNRFYLLLHPDILVFLNVCHGSIYHHMLLAIPLDILI